MNKKILIIEDNQNNLDLMTYLLNHYGYITVTAYDGEEGIAKAMTEHPDLIICDILLLKLSGYEVVKYLKSHPLLCEIPLIAITAYAMMGDRAKFLATGFDGYISKPISPELFVSQIESFCVTSSPLIG